MVVVTEIPEPGVLKEEGNTAFKAGKYAEAVEIYSQALLQDVKDADKAVLLKNRAACYLKLERNTDAAKDCSDVLDICPNDPKALFRRCQAFEGMERYEEAYKDAAALIRVDPKNKAIQPIMQRLQPIIHKKVEQQSMTGSKVSQMFNLTFNDKEIDMEKKKQAANNLIVLAREEAGAEKMYESGGVEMLMTLMGEKDGELRLTGVRVMACMAQNSRKRATGIVEKMTLKKIMILMSQNDEALSTATANLLQNILNSITDIENIKKEREKYETARLSDSSCKWRPFPFIAYKIDPEVVPLVDQIFLGLIQMLNQKKVSAYGRDNALELIIKFVTQKEAVGWSVKFIEKGGLQSLLEVAGAIMEHKLLPVTENSRMHASLALSKIYNDLIGDKEREKYRDAVDAFFVDLFGDNIMESKVESVMALAALLQGPFEVGNHILGRTGVLEMILAMADSDNAMHVKYAVEALVHSSSKKERCSGVIKQATPILKQLYQSRNEHVKVRALVGLCKLGSFGGSDVSMKSFADGSTQTLAKACRKFLKNPAKDVDLRKWAAEGLAYLTLDADVKEEVVEDTDALKSLMELAKIPDKGILYPVAQVFVNMCNAYDTKEPEPELVELAKFAKHHVPKEHPKDSPENASERVNKLVKAGLINALVALSKTESENSRELLARVYQAVACNTDHRGLMVQQGAAKALIPLALEGTKEGKMKAAQALAKIGITMNPEVAFPGQRMCEVVRPLVLLLDVERSALENFESLMALTNLASVSGTVRKRILKEHGFSKIEYYIYEEHELLKRAALECMCNLMMEEDTLRYFKGETDRVKYFLLCAGECMEEDDMNVCRATAGGLAMISHDKEIANKIITCTTQWYEILQTLAIHPVPQVQHRGLHIIMNLMSAEKEICEKIVASPLLEVLLAFSKFDDPERASVKITAERCLEKAMEWELIQPTPEGQESKPISKEVLAKLLASFHARNKREDVAEEKPKEEKKEKTGKEAPKEGLTEQAASDSAKPALSTEEAAMMERIMGDPSMQQAMLQSDNPEQAKLARLMAAMTTVKQQEAAGTLGQSASSAPESDQSDRLKPDISQLDDSHLAVDHAENMPSNQSESQEKTAKQQDSQSDTHKSGSQSDASNKSDPPAT